MSDTEKIYHTLTYGFFLYLGGGLANLAIPVNPVLAVLIGVAALALLIGGSIAFPSPFHKETKEERQRLRRKFKLRPQIYGLIAVICLCALCLAAVNNQSPAHILSYVGAAYLLSMAAIIALSLRRLKSRMRAANP